MAENKDMQSEYDCFSEVWKFYKNYYDMPNKPETWKEVVESSREIGKRYNNQLCNDLLVAVIMDLERKCIKPGEEKEVDKKFS